MTTPIRAVRLSPCGPRLGSPPLLVGPGSIGLVWRFHANAGLGPMAVTAPAAFDSMSTLPVQMKTGYKYDIELQYPIEGRTVTAQATWVGSFRLHYTSGVWGGWTNFSDPAGPHILEGSTYAINPTNQGSDAYFDLTVTGAVDAIDFGGQGTDPGMYVNTRVAWARVTEYMP